MDLNNSNQINLLAERDEARRRLRELVDAVKAFKQADESDVFLDIVEDSDGYIENANELNRARIKRGDALKAMHRLAAEIDKELSPRDRGGQEQDED